MNRAGWANSWGDSYCLEWLTFISLLEMYYVYFACMMQSSWLIALTELVLLSLSVRLKHFSHRKDQLGLIHVKTNGGVITHYTHALTDDPCENRSNTSKEKEFCLKTETSWRISEHNNTVFSGCFIPQFSAFTIAASFQRTAPDLTYIRQHICIYIYPPCFAMLYTEDLLSTNYNWTQFIEASLDMIKFVWDAINQKYNYKE